MMCQQGLFGIAQEERSRAISFIFSGLQVGSLAGLLVAPPLIERFGWEIVFYIFGATGARGVRLNVAGHEAGRMATRQPFMTESRVQVHLHLLSNSCSLVLRAWSSARPDPQRCPGLLWCVWWERVMADIKATEPEVAAQLLPATEEATADGAQPADRGTPWRGFLRSGPVSRFLAGHRFT
jgi:MFS family permease